MIFSDSSIHEYLLSQEIFEALQEKNRSQSAFSQKIRRKNPPFFQNPSSPLLQDHSLAGDLEGYRAFSVTGDYRVVYFKEEVTFHLYDIGTHNQVY